ncbi:DNA-processing protein DprA [Comamonadaceae bacterium SL12-8]|uniref:DNA-processing protein DprA n=1 Tax=Amphibiibacter pelophylacis TaxID=1799477 RepID=A0ACC6P1R6_9BURK
MTPTAASDPDELLAWLRLLLAPGLGRRGVRQLLARLGSPQAVVGTTASALNALLPGAGTALSDAEVRQQAEAQLASTQAWLADASARRHVLVPGDTDYPALLLETPDPPLMLFAQGDLAALRLPALAMVGSRNPTAGGEDNARAFARHFASCGLCVVSGLAQGVDAAAHQGALAAATGAPATLAVVGTGLDRVYPASHRDLAHAIAQNGLLLSEYLLGTPARSQNFPQRNRLIAGLSLGTLVVEAAMGSGSLITARLATEMGREVFAIPGSIHAPQVKGCHALIKQGARLVEVADDVLSELRLQPAPVKTAAASPRRRGASASRTPPAASSSEIVTPSQAALLPGCAQLLEALGHDPLDLDQLQARTGETTADLMARLLDLELQGQVQRLPGGRYQRRGWA